MYASRVCARRLLALTAPPVYKDLRQLGKQPKDNGCGACLSVSNNTNQCCYCINAGL